MYRIVVWFPEGGVIADRNYCAYSIGMGSLLKNELRATHPQALAIYVKDLDTNEEYWSVKEGASVDLNSMLDKVIL